MMIKILWQCFPNRLKLNMMISRRRSRKNVPFLYHNINLCQTTHSSHATLATTPGCTTFHHLNEGLVSHHHQCHNHNKLSYIKLCMDLNFNIWFIYLIICLNTANNSINYARANTGTSNEDKKKLYCCKYGCVNSVKLLFVLSFSYVKETLSNSHHKNGKIYHIYFNKTICFLLFPIWQIPFMESTRHK